MEQSTAGHSRLLHQWLERDAARDPGVYGLVSQLESYVRIAALLGITHARADSKYAPRLTPQIGLGGWRDALTRAVDTSTRSNSQHLPLLKELNEGVSRVWGKSISGAPPGLANVKILRDFLSHGGIVADSEGLIERSFLELNKEIRNSLLGFLEGAQITCEGHDDKVVTILSRGSSQVELSPLIQATPANELLVYASKSSRETAFHCLSAYSTTRPIRWLTIDWPDGIFRDDRVATAPVDLFKASLMEDLSAFSDAQERPIFLEEPDTTLRLLWRWAVSSGAEDRRDSFRLGVDDARQWQRDSGEWVPYSEFLKHVSNWPIVADRLASSFRERWAENAANESQYLPFMVDPDVEIPARLSVSEMGSASHPDEATLTGMKASDLLSEIDDISQENVGRTLITFVDGDAGSGKTRLLLGAALRRAELLSQTGAGAHAESQLPILLYVSSTGRVLDDLTLVVEAAVAKTLNLTVDRIKALARNSLIVLLIDGFDELLGSSSYADALGSLRPWIADLQGRGAIVLSARSSYYENQYRRSVAKMPIALPVRHRSVRMEPWNDAELREFLIQAGGDPEVLKHLAKNEAILARLPFFARVLVATDPVQVTSVSFSLTRSLVESYVQREALKFSRGTNLRDHLISHEELFRIFEEVALLMAGDSKREVDLDSLELAADAVIPNVHQDRKELIDRLTTLCGLSVSGVGEEVLFTFKHEFFFDEFLSSRVGRLWTDCDSLALWNALGYDLWRPSMVSSLLRKLGPDEARRLSEGMVSRLELASTASESANFRLKRVNIGSLWSQLVKSHPDRMLPHALVNLIFVDGLDFASHAELNIELERCEVSRLTVPRASGWCLGLTGSRVSVLDARAAGRGLVTGVMNEGIQAIVSPSNYCTDWNGVYRELLQLGCEFDSSAQAPEGNPSSLIAQHGRAFLRSMISSVNSGVVLKEDRTFDKDSNYGGMSYAWLGSQKDLAKFVRCLERYDFAKCEPMSARGVAKVRMRFRIGPQDLLDAHEQRIGEFWAELT